MVRTLFWLVIVLVLAVAGYRLLLTHPDARSRDAAGNCLLRARVYTDGEGTANPRRVFGMQNLDEANWVDVQAIIDGVVVAGPNENQPTGPYEHTLPTYDSGVAARKVREIPLDDFRSQQGPRWIAMTMRVRHARINARIGAERCTFESPIPASAAAR